MFTKKQVNRVALLALAVSITLLAIKFLAYSLTGSAAVLSDAVESIINVVTGLFLVLSMTVSTMPADESHPYGHGKIESFSAGLEGGLILLAAITIFIEAIPEFFAPTPPSRLDAGMVLLAGAGVVNLLLGYYIMQLGRRYRSAALDANGRHLITDFSTSAGVILGLVLVRLTGWSWLDPLIACLVAVNILLPGGKLVRTAVRNLMDEADPDLLERVVAALNDLRRPGLLCPHELRVIRYGRRLHMDLHITLPANWPLAKAHDTEEEVAQALLGTLGEEGDVMIHIDPCDESCCPCCCEEGCPERKDDFTKEHIWDLQQVTGPLLSCPIRATRKANSK